MDVDDSSPPSKVPISSFQTTDSPFGSSLSLNAFGPEISIKLQYNNVLFYNQHVEGTVLMQKLHKFVANMKIPLMYKYKIDKK